MATSFPTRGVGAAQPARPASTVSKDPTPESQHTAETGRAVPEALPPSPLPSCRVAAAAEVPDPRIYELEVRIRSLGAKLDAHVDAEPVANQFRRSGGTWVIGFEREPGHFADAKGLAHIHRLLRHPNESMPAVSLMRTVGQPITHQVAEAVENELLSDTAGFSPQEISDDVALRAVERAITQTIERIEEERRAANLAAVEQAQTELAKLMAYRRQAKGLSSRARMFAGSSPDEKARQAVSKSLKRAYERLALAKPEQPRLIEHLKASIKTEGTAYAYRPLNPAPKWQLE